ncbi:MULTISPECIES: hypothetical protein [Legionella]|uniref:Uncharacterized protein n=1 Tax=Legionella resiliens TaxID=2905958 RepID=A0ABS8X6H0_9GAMM|nr:MULTISPECIES: hypothetical protein [unclassified Legionella]MCE0723256.1 hypothetical protein [Legionella sp. 9fVS26]MCE3532409.1 hypothetical protein [Legionella sp. 8cVS16]
MYNTIQGDRDNFYIYNIYMDNTCGAYIYIFYGDDIRQDSNTNDDFYNTYDTYDVYDVHDGKHSHYMPKQTGLRS